MTDRNDKKKRKKKKQDKKSTNPDDNDEESDEPEDPMDYFQRMMNEFGKQMGVDFKNVDFTKIMQNIMKQFYPGMENLSEEELQKIMKENMARMGTMGLFFTKVKMNVGKDGMPKFERIGNKQSKNRMEPVMKEEREPLVDIMEEEEEIIVVAEIPGCAKENIDLETTNTSLTIIACDEDKVRKYHTTVDLPSKINPDHARARYRNGILEVKLKKKMKGKKKGNKISVD